MIVILFSYRGVSSTVRRCVEKETGREFAAKIIDVSADLEDSQGLTLRQATIREISILKLVAGHPYISKLNLIKSQSSIQINLAIYMIIFYSRIT